MKPVELIERALVNSSKAGDLVLIVADADPMLVAKALGELRVLLGRRLGLIRNDVHALCWVVEFPLLEWSTEEQRWTAMHHPFTSAMDEDWDLLETDPGKVRAKAYDIVMDGWEVGGGSIRIHQRFRQSQMFKALGIGPEEAEEKFGHLLEAFEYGADKAYVIDAPVFRHYRTESYLRAICHLVERYKPEIILMGATGLGRDLAGAVATDLKTGLTADCTGLGIDDKRNLMQTRPAFGGNIMATIMCDRFRPQMATVRPQVMPLPEKQANATGTIIRSSFIIPEANIFTKVLEIIHNRKDKGNVDITGADFIVSGGRGLMAKENFKLLQELAGEADAVIGAHLASFADGEVVGPVQAGR